MNCRECGANIDNDDLAAEVNESADGLIEVFAQCKECGLLCSAFVTETNFVPVD